MHTTSNFKLKKPEGTDVVNIEDINSNMDKLDVEVAKKASHSTDGRMAKEDKTKLDGIASGANKYVHPSTHSIDMISETSSKKVMTSTERSKLAGIASGANKYVHPSKHSAGVITQDSSHRFVTDSEKSSWSSKADGKHTHDDRYYTESEVNSKLSKIDKAMEDIAYNTAGGSANAITVSKSNFTLTNGQYVEFKAINTNTGHVTLNVNRLGAKNLKDEDGYELSAGVIEKNNYYKAIWDENFFLLAPKNGGDISFSKYITKGEKNIILYDKKINKNSYVYVSNDIVLLTDSGTTQKIPSIYNAISEDDLKVSQRGTIKIARLNGNTNVVGFISKYSKNIILPNKSHWTYGDYIDKSNIQESPNEIWNIAFSKYIKVITVDKDFIYVGGGSHILYKIDKNTKQKIWEFTRFTNAIHKMVIDDNYIYAGSYDRTIRKIDKNTNKEIWNITGFKYGLDSIAIDNDYIYVGKIKLVKIDKNTKQERWTFRTEGLVEAIAVDDNYVYVGTQYGTIYKLDKNTKKEIWSFTGAKCSINSMAVDNNYIYAGLYDGTLRKIDKNTKKEIWNFTGFTRDINSIAIDNNYIYAGSDDDTLRKIDKNTKEEIWSVTDNICVNAVAIDDNYIYAGIGGNDGNLKKIDINGDVHLKIIEGN